MYRFKNNFPEPLITLGLDFTSGAKPQLSPDIFFHTHIHIILVLLNIIMSMSFNSDSAHLPGYPVFHISGHHLHYFHNFIQRSGLTESEAVFVLT